MKKPLANKTVQLNYFSRFAELTEKINESWLTEAVTLEELWFELDAQYRFEQEMIYYLEKMDVTEELVRLKGNCDYFLEILEDEEMQGKKLGFISQEIGREINTLGSKANDAEMQRSVVQMKDELEKIKEQILNVL